MSGKKQPNDMFFITARVHWPKLFAFDTYTDPDTGEVTPQPPSVSIMLHKENDAELIKQIKGRVAAVCRMLNPNKEKDGPNQGKGRLLAPEKMLLQDGDFLKGPEYQDHFKFTAKVQQPREGGEAFPYVADPYDPDIRITESSGNHKIYGGCVCNLGIQFWFSKKYGRVGASLHSIQFEEDGERLIGGQVSDQAATEGFSKKKKPSIADQDEWDEPGGTPGSNDEASADFEDDIPF